MIRYVSAVLVLVGLSGCSTVEFESQSLELSHNLEADSLSLQLTYGGLRAGGLGLEQASDWVRGVIAHEPRFVVFGWPFEFDIKKNGGEFLRARIKTQEARATTDSSGLRVEQTISCEDAQALIVRANAMLNEETLKELAKPGVLDPDPSDWLDGETRRLALAHSKAGNRWLALNQSGLHLYLPCSRRVFQDGLHSLIANPPEDPTERALLGQLATQLTELSYANGRLHLTFALGSQETLQFTIQRTLPAKDDSGALANEFRGM